MVYQKNKSVLQRYILSLVKKGKLARNEKLVFNLLSRIKKEEKVSRPLEVLEKSLSNVEPLVGLVNKRVGARKIAVPIALERGKEKGVGMRWLIDSANELEGMKMEESLYSEVKNAYRGEGKAMGKRKVRHKLAQDNRAFLKYL